MNRDLITENDIRDYLLGRVSDDERLEAFDELLFSDDEFASMAEVAEQGLIDEYSSMRMAANDITDFTRLLENNRDLREKTAIASMLRAKALTVAEAEKQASFFDSFKALLRQPAFVGGFALLLIAIIAVAYFVLRPKTDELADLRAVYNKERPTESRISAFDYAPLVTTRGSAEEREATRLRRIELTLIEATERTPTAAAFHSVGVFYLTQQEFGQAIQAFEKSVKLEPNNARSLNDLGSAYFEQAKSDPVDLRFKTLSTALENFSKSVTVDSRFPAGLFNKALCLQELRLTNEARESWEQYLRLDPSSGWAGEARKNLEKLDQLSMSFKSKEGALSDIIAAYKDKDEARAWNIVSQTREMVTGVWLPDQLTRKFLEAKIRGDDAVASDSIGALKLIGKLERSRNADFFVSEMADFYSSTRKFAELMQAKDSYAAGFANMNSKGIEIAIHSFSVSREAFLGAGDHWNSMVADLWVAQTLTDHSKIAESQTILTNLLAKSNKRSYKWLALVTNDWAANNFLLRNELGRSNSQNIVNLDVAQQLSDASMLVKVSIALVVSYEGVGEIERASEILGRMDTVGSPYLRNGVREWQRNFYAASVAGKLGGLNAAHHFAKQALVDVRNCILKESQATDDTIRLLIDLNRKKGDLTAALRYARETQQLASETTDPIFRSKLTRYALQQIGDLRREMGDNEEAFAAYSDALKLAASDDEVRIDAYDLEKGKLLALIALGRNDEATLQLNRTLELSESLRSRILDDVSRLAFFNTEQSVYEAAISNALSTGDTLRAFDLMETSRARNLLDFVEGETSLEQLETEYQTVAKPVTLSEIQRSIPENVQIVEYLMLPDKLAIYCVDRTKFSIVVTVDKAVEIDSTVSDFIDETVNRRSSPEQTRALSNSLYKRLIEPVLPQLNVNKQLVIIPDKTLNKLPYAALQSGSNQRFLIEDFALSYSPSTNVFVRMTDLATARDRSDEKIAVVGNPKFNREENSNLQDLPSAGEEAKLIAGMYSSSELILGQQAGKSEVLSKLIRSPIFHFAGHYVANTTSLINSRLILAEGPEKSGDLRLSELAKQKLNNTKFIVLSACDTNAEKLFAGEGATGITQTLLAIGSPLVVAGNWKVDSDSTRDLMIAFHQQRTTNGFNVARSLQQAQLSQMRSPDDLVRPAFYWAAFSAVGGATDY